MRTKFAAMAVLMLAGLALAGWIANDPGPAMPERTASVNAIRERIGAPQLADHGIGAGSSAIATP